jgi:hypothetical protein
MNTRFLFTFSAITVVAVLLGIILILFLAGTPKKGNADNEITSYPETTDVTSFPEVISSPISTHADVIEPAEDKYSLRLKGVCVSPGGVMMIDGKQVPDLSKDCKLEAYNPFSGDIKLIATAEKYSTGKDLINDKFTLPVYSQIYLGELKDNIQRVILFGGEGSSQWGKIWEVNLSTFKMKHLSSGSRNWSAKPNIEADNNDYYYYFITKYTTEGECGVTKADSGKVYATFDARCIRYLSPYKVPDCQDLKSEQAYAPSCFSNYDELMRE